MGSLAFNYITRKLMDFFSGLFVWKRVSLYIYRYEYLMKIISVVFELTLKRKFWGYTNLYQLFYIVLIQRFMHGFVNRNHASLSITCLSSSCSWLCLRGIRLLQSRGNYAIFLEKKYTLSRIQAIYLSNFIKMVPRFSLEKVTNKKTYKRLHL